VFNKTIQNLASRTFSGLSKASTAVGNTLLDGAIEGISERSPLIGNALATKVNTTRITKQVAAKFIESTSKEGFGDDVRKEVGKDASDQEVKKKMASILDQLTKDVKKQSEQELKTNDLYQKYSKHFDEYKAKVTKAIDDSKPGKPGDPGKDGSDTSSDQVIEKLDNIEANTKELVTKFDSATDPTDPAQIESSQQDQPSDSDRYTHKMNSKDGVLKEIVQTSAAAIPGLPIISPEMLDAAVEPKKTESASNFETTLKTFEASETKQVSVNESILDAVQLTNQFLKQAEEDRARAEASSDELAAEARKVAPASSNSALTKLQNKTDSVNKNQKNSPSLLDRLLDKAGPKGVPKVPGGAMLGTVAKFAGGAAAVGAAGYAGYKAGEFLNENTNIQENIAGGVETVKGWFGNSFKDKQKEADEKSVKDLYEKKVKEGTLTAKSAKFFEDRGVKVDKSKIVKIPEAVKNTTTSEIAQSVETKDIKDAAKEAATNAAPVVLNTTNNVSGGSSSPTIISGMNIRNSETSFDRVQMQNYWSRTA